MKDDPIYRETLARLAPPGGRRRADTVNVKELRRLLGFAADTARDCEDAGLALLRHEQEAAQLHSLGTSNLADKYGALRGRVG